MSKYLVKILSVCALVVLMAVTIVGAAIGVTEAVGVTLTVIDTTSTGTTSTESNVKIFVNNEEQKENKLTFAKYTEVKLVYTALDGYKFDGWYDTDSTERVEEKRLSKEVEYTFEVCKTMTVSAFADKKSYTVTFSGLMPDGTTSVTDPITQGGAGLSANETYAYGQELPTIPSTDTVGFEGWKVDTQEGTQDATIYTTAIFDTNPVTLVPAYSDRQLTQYTLKIQKSIKDTEVIANLSFNKNQPAVFNPTREGYKLKGIMYKDELRAYDYTSHTFPDLFQVVSAGSETTIEAYAVWECDYDSVALKFNGFATYLYNGQEREWGVMANGNPMESGQDPYYVQFVDGIEEGNVDLEDNIFDLYFNSLSEFTTIDGRAVRFTGKIRMTVEGSTGFDNLNLQATEPYNYTYLELLLALSERDITDKVITVTFLFELA